MKGGAAKTRALSPLDSPEDMNQTGIVALSSGFSGVRTDGFFDDVGTSSKKEIRFYSRCFSLWCGTSGGRGRDFSPRKISARGKG